MLVELGVGHTVNVGDVFVVSQDAFYHADNWFVSGWYARVRIMEILVLALPPLSDHLNLDPAV